MRLLLVAEALANAAKYAGATAATVSVREDVDTVTVDIRDNGCGGACPTTGGGLEGLADRVSAFGGTLTIESPVDVARGCTRSCPCRATTPDPAFTGGSYRPATRA